MILSRQKSAISGTYLLDKEKTRKKKLPKLNDLLEERDYLGAITLLEFNQNSIRRQKYTKLWIAYCAFHLGDYRRAYEIYLDECAKPEFDLKVWVNLACCSFYLGLYKEAKDASAKGIDCDLNYRLNFHLAHKLNDDKNLMRCHSKMSDSFEDKISYASFQFMRGHYREALALCKNLLALNKNYVALNLYTALCYYKLSYFDLSRELLDDYLSTHPNSYVALNLKACLHFKQYGGKQAEAELKPLKNPSSHCVLFGLDLINHNKVVFRRGAGAMQILPPLVDVVAEARINLAIYHFQQDEYEEAYKLCQNLTPTGSPDYILKAAAFSAYGQEEGLVAVIKAAQQYYHLVGHSSGECDTVVGRRCLAAHFFLLRQFEEVVLYLDTIKGYLYHDDVYNFNFAQAKAACGNYKDAEEIFKLIQSEKIKTDFVYVSWLARCHIVNKQPHSAWEMYLKMDTSADSYSLLQLIANDCYRMRCFYVAAKAFDVLERIDPNPEYWDGKRGACVGLFQQIVAGREPRETLNELLMMLQNTSNPQSEYIGRTIGKWAKENNVNLEVA
uniref:Intraflagellar transport protein 56 n=1 Tax=Phallusia mammillata TaxID=59560 RepID=A0A6F9DV79_9ASCI|nr:intraflagellar transport protein 56-like [Phallusia mammillata]